MRWTAPFQSTPPARGATKKAHYHVLWRYISIHAPREGGDTTAATDPVDLFDFNPRPPRGGRPGHSAGRTAGQNFNPRPPRGGRRQKRPWADEEQRFQSTPPARGATWYITASPPDTPRFQSTPPARGATRGNRSAAVFLERFQSTPPARGATSSVATVTPTAAISIHAPREGGDINLTINTIIRRRFQSTPPARGATITKLLINIESLNFNPRPPRGGRRRRGKIS